MLLFEDVFKSCLTTCSHHVYRHFDTIFEYLLTMFTQCLKACLHNVRRHTYTMLEVIPTLDYNKCLRHVWNMFNITFKNIETIFEDVVFTLCMQVCFHFVWRHNDTMFSQYLKTCFHNIWKNYTKFLKTCLKSCLHYLWRHFSNCFMYVYTLYKDMFIQCLRI